MTTTFTATTNSYEADDNGAAFTTVTLDGPKFSSTGYEGVSKHTQTSIHKVVEVKAHQMDLRTHGSVINLTLRTEDGTNHRISLFGVTLDQLAAAVAAAEQVTA